ncbi:hypothetical protein [Catenulispora subtropica]|uniref:Uncharacterized protein n=1 Tax=Catenulispora subtropica TaxID=450798 RepID=A0ABN2T0A5_9ACTN
MTTLSARAKRALVPIGACTTALVVAAAAYAVAGTGPGSNRPEAGTPGTGTAGTRSTTAAAVTTTAATSPPSAAAAAPDAGPAAADSPSPGPALANGNKTSPPPPASPYVGRIGMSTSTSPSAVDTIGITPARAGTTLVATVLLLGNTSGTPQVTDTVGNTYQLQVNQADGTGDTLLVFTATGIRALAATDTVSVAYPASAAHAVAVDDFAAGSTVDQVVAATGTGTAASTGRTAKTSAAEELAVAALADPGGTVALNGYTKLAPLTVGPAHVDIGWRSLTAVGTYQADGTSAEPWIAGLLTIR